MFFVHKVGELWSTWRRRCATAGAGFVAMYILYLAIFGANGLIAFRHKKAEYRKLQNEIQRMQTENKKLDDNIKSLKSDPKAIEKEAREQLKYAKPGEVIYVMPERPAQPSTATAKKK